MSRPKSADRMLIGLTLCSQIDAYGTLDSILHPTVQPQEVTMLFVSCLVLGLAAGFVGSRLENKEGNRVLPDVLLGVGGAMVGGWLYYDFGPASVNGFHLISLFAAFVGSLACLLTYYAIKRF